MIIGNGHNVDTRPSISIPIAALCVEEYSGERGFAALRIEHGTILKMFHSVDNGAARREGLKGCDAVIFFMVDRNAGPRFPDRSNRERYHLLPATPNIVGHL